MIDIEHGKVINFDYVNWRGEKSNRTVEVWHIQYGVSEWHPEPCFLLTGFDDGKGDERNFAMKDMSNIKEV